MQAEFNIVFKRRKFTPFFRDDPDFLHTRSMTPCQPVVCRTMNVFSLQILGCFYFLYFCRPQGIPLFRRKNKAKEHVVDGLAGDHRALVQSFQAYEQQYSMLLSIDWIDSYAAVATKHLSGQQVVVGCRYFRPKSYNQISARKKLNLCCSFITDKPLSYSVSLAWNLKPGPILFAYIG